METMEQTLAGTGLPDHRCRYLAYVARAHGWSDRDVADLVSVATNSSSIRSPRAFVTSRIKQDIKETPAPAGETFSQTLANLACPECRQHPCCCDWDGEKETYREFKARIYGVCTAIRPVELSTVQSGAQVI